MTDNRSPLDAEFLERLSLLTEPDRRLDLDIAITLGTCCKASGPYYTASVDAAATLVPEGSVWMVVSDGRAVIWMPESELKPYRARGVTPAIGLCRAAFLSRANQPRRGTASNRG